MPSLIQIGRFVLEKKILNFVNIFSLLLNGNRCGPSLNKLESSLPTDALYPVWLNLTRWFWGRRNCENDNNVDGQRTICDQKSSFEPA